METTLPETNMETQKGPDKDYSPFKGGLYGFPCWFGGVYYVWFKVLGLREYSPP